MEGGLRITTKPDRWEMLHKALCGVPGHQLVAAMCALAAIEAQRESKALLDVLRGCRR